MSDLKEQLIKLGTDNKALRPHIRPILNTLSKTAKRAERVDRQMLAEIVSQHQRVTPLREMVEKIEEARENGLDYLFDSDGVYKNGAMLWFILNDLNQAGVIRILPTSRGGSKYIWKKGPYKGVKFTQKSADKAAMKSRVMSQYAQKASVK